MLFPFLTLLNPSEYLGIGIPVISGHFQEKSGFKRTITKFFSKIFIFLDAHK